MVGIRHGLPHHFRESVAVEEVVAEHETDAVIADEVLADQEGLSQAVGAGLLGVLESHAIVAAVAEEPTEGGQVLRGGDNQDVPDPGLHEDGNRVVDHRLVEDGQELLAHAFGDWIEAGAAAAGENDSFHRISRLRHSSRLSRQYGIGWPKVARTLDLSSTE